jgi:hypothetical protein
MILYICISGVGPPPESSMMILSPYSPKCGKNCLKKNYNSVGGSIEI